MSNSSWSQTILNGEPFDETDRNLWVMSCWSDMKRRPIVATFVGHDGSPCRLAGCCFCATRPRIWISCFNSGPRVRGKNEVGGLASEERTGFSLQRGSILPSITHSEGEFCRGDDIAKRQTFYARSLVSWLTRISNAE